MKTDPNFFSKKMGVCLLQHPRSCKFFTHNIFMISPLKIKNFGKKLYGHNPFGMLNHICFQNFKKLNLGLKIGILKMLSKNSVSSTHTGTLEIWWHLINKMSDLKKWKKRILGLKWGSGSKLNWEIFLKL